VVIFVIRFLKNNQKSNYHKKEAVANAIGSTGSLFHYGYDTAIHQFDSLNTFAVSVPTAALEGLSNNPNIVHVEQDPIRLITPIIKPTTAVPFHQRQATYGQTIPYGVDMVQVHDVWDVNSDGVMDTGTQRLQPHSLHYQHRLYDLPRRSGRGFCHRLQW
jgi:hypothetical protein